MIKLKNKKIDLVKKFNNKHELLSSIEGYKLGEYLSTSIDPDKNKKVRDIKVDEFKGYTEIAEDNWTINEIVDTFFSDYERL